MALLAGAIVFVAVQLLFTVVVDVWHPEVYDEEFGVRMGLLHARQTETPDRPLLLLMGSSRTVMNFRPELLPEMRTTTGTAVLPFNFSHLGAGPTMTLMEYHRLRRAGVRPTWLALEVMPPCLSNESPSVMTACMSVLDLPLLHRYVNWSTLYGQFVKTRLLPLYRHRQEVVHGLSPAWATPDSSGKQDRIRLGPLGGDDGWLVRNEVPADFLQRQMELTRADYYPQLQQFTVKESARRAYRELIETCRRDGVHVVLLLTPEGPAFRSWYREGGLRQIDAFCDEVRRDYGVDVIDTRTWLPESDFIDSHHVCLHGAKEFTTRLGREVLQPLVRQSLADGQGTVSRMRRASPGTERQALSLLDR
jgi:hypothetical protein